MKLKSIKQFNRDLRKCRYCSGTGFDIFQKNKPCPNCSKDVAAIMTEEEKEQIINDKINRDIFEDFATA